jgi:RNA polymerase sigma factor (TIGR02999 family)
MEPSGNITVLLKAWQGGDRAAFERLSASVYDELRSMARRRLASERGGHTLQPTALVHEAYMRLVDGDVDWRDRAHFFATAALHMRSVLVDHARARLADKRGGGALRVTLDERSAGASGDADADADFLALDEALRTLEREDPRTAKVIELTYFGGLKREEIAHVLEVSVPTVDRGLRFGRAWLKQSLGA